MEMKSLIESMFAKKLDEAKEYAKKGDKIKTVSGKVVTVHNVTNKGVTYKDDDGRVFSARNGHYSIVNEAKGSDYTISHKTFSSAVQHAIEVVKKRGYEVDEEEWDRKVALGPKKPSKGKTNTYTINLLKNGKETPRKLQMQVYYDEGRYELNMYIS